MSGSPTGLTLSFVQRATGLGKSKIKMIQSRHAELQELPYSTRTGGARIYFQPFIDWLAKYEGAEAAEKLSHESHKDVTSVTSQFSGAFVRELRLTMGADRATTFLFGLARIPEPTTTPRPMGAGRAALGLPAPRPLLGLEAGLSAIHNSGRFFFTIVDLREMLGMSDDDIAEACHNLAWAREKSFSSRDLVKLWTTYHETRAAALKQAEAWRASHPAEARA